MTIAVAIGLGLAGSVAGAGFVGDAYARTDATAAQTDYPDVNRVPQTAPAAPTAREMRSATQGLAADRSRARADESGARPSGEGQTTKAKYGKVGGPSRSLPTRIAEPPVSAAPAAPAQAQPQQVPYGRSAPPAGVAQTAAPGSAAAAAPSGEPAQMAPATGGAVATRPAVRYGRETQGYGYGTGARQIETRQRVHYGRSTMPQGSPSMATSPGAVPGMALPAPYQLPGGVLVDSSGERAVDAQTVAFLNVTPGPGFAANFIPAYSTLVGEIYFSSSSSGLDGNDMAVLREIADYQRANGGYLRVTGHASSRTGDMSVARHELANLQVSNRRAEAVRRALERLGVPPGAIFSSAESDRQAVYKEVMPSGEAFNRRVEIYLEY